MDKILESFKLKQSWTYLFKEKQWGWKLLVPVVPGLILAIILLIIAIPVIFLLSAATDKGSFYGTDFYSSVGGIFPLIILCACCVIAIYTIIQSVISYWYQYEYTQISLEGRESNLISKSSKGEVFKKAGKLFLVNVIYNIPTSILLGVFYVLFIFTGGVRQTPYITAARTASNLSAVGILLLCVIFFIALFIVLPYNFYIVQTAKVRLIKTNTFGEAFKLGLIWETVKKNFKRLSIFLGVLIGMFFVYFILNLILSVMSAIPFVGLCLFPFNLALSLIAGFFGVFVYPYMLGNVYKEIN